MNNNPDVIPELHQKFFHKFVLINNLIIETLTEKQTVAVISQLIASGDAIVAKNEINKGREYMHGGKLA